MRRHLINLLTRQYVGIGGFAILLTLVGVLSVIGIHIVGGKLL
jgi:hypothetical protein